MFTWGVCSSIIKIARKERLLEKTRLKPLVMINLKVVYFCNFCECFLTV